MKYCKAYMGIYPVVTKKFSRAAPERSLKVFRASVFSNCYEIVVS